MDNFVQINVITYSSSWILFGNSKMFNLYPLCSSSASETSLAHVFETYSKKPL